jgi:hypothetical protein
MRNSYSLVWPLTLTLAEENISILFHMGSLCIFTSSKALQIINLIMVCNLQCLCGHINEFVRRYA